MTTIGAKKGPTTIGGVACATHIGLKACGTSNICEVCSYAVGDTIHLRRPVVQLAYSWPDEFGCAISDIRALFDSYPLMPMARDLFNDLPLNLPYTITAIDTSTPGFYLYTLIYSGSWPTLLGNSPTTTGSCGCSWDILLPDTDSVGTGYHLVASLTMKLRMICDISSNQIVFDLDDDVLNFSGVMVGIKHQIPTGFPPPMDPYMTVGCSARGAYRMPNTPGVTITDSGDCRAIRPFDWYWWSDVGHEISIDDGTGSVQVLP